MASAPSILGFRRRLTRYVLEPITRLRETSRARFLPLTRELLLTPGLVFLRMPPGWSTARPREQGL